MNVPEVLGVAGGTLALIDILFQHEKFRPNLSLTLMVEVLAVVAIGYIVIRSSPGFDAWLDQLGVS